VPGRRISRTRPISVGVPNLGKYSRFSGIGRVLWSLSDCWSGQVTLHQEEFEFSRLPILRNIPHGIATSTDTDLIMLPQMTGAQGLRSTRGVPTIVIVHDVGIVDFPGDLKALDHITKWSILGSFRALRYASHIITVSDFTRGRLIEHFPEVEDRTSAIPNGVSDLYLSFDESVELCRETVVRKYGAHPDAPILVYVGSEHPRKNVSTLLGALRRLKRRYPDTQLLKVGQSGNPDWRENTTRIASELGLSVGSDILFIEGVDDTELARIYRAADLFVSASFYEGFGLPALEAMAVGTRAVVSNRGAFPEVVGDTDWLAEPNTDCIAEELERALSLINRDEPDKLAIERARTMSWANSSEQYLAVIRSLTEHSIQASSNSL
jgi:glycosyltransferase involved in cell wall biosynthesis